MAKVNPTNVISEIHPAWLDTIVPDNYQDEGLFNIILFYVFYSPCPGQSHRHVPLSTYGWKAKPWYSPSYLKEPLDKIIFGDKDRLFLVTSRAEFSDKISNYDFSNDFCYHRDQQRIALVRSDGKNSSEYMSLFYHIRNCFAHGRIAMYPAPNKDIMFVMEDGRILGSEADNAFEVTARIVLLKSSLLKIIDYLRNPPPEIDYSDDVLLAMKKGKYTKREIIDELSIDESIWDRTIQKLKNSNRITFYKNKWKISEEE